MSERNRFISQMPRILGICFFASSVMFGFASCEEVTPETPDEPVVDVADTPDAKITLTNGDLVELSAVEGATTSFIFKTDHKWTLEIPEDATWLTADKMEGEKRVSTTIKFTAAANTAPEVRKATCVIRSGKNSKKISVEIFYVRRRNNESHLLLTNSYLL